jgi:hypothetical protein
MGVAAPRLALAAVEREPVLVVNDRPADLLAIEAVLPFFVVVRANSGREALRQLLTQSFAVIILDVNMPDLDGFETARLIRQRPRSEYTPIIFVTAARLSAEDRAQGYALGAVDYLPSPVEPEVLRAKVAVFAELYNKQEAVREQAEMLARLNAELERQGRRAAEANEILQRENAARRKVEAILERRAGELESANQDLDAFSYSVAHDLRAPLRAIVGFVQALLEEHAATLDETGRAYLGRVFLAATRMSGMLDGLLQLAHVARSTFAPAVIDLSEIALTVLDELARAHPERHVERIVAPDVRARADPALLHIVLSNLLGNAWKFTRTRPDAQVEFGVDERNGEFAVFVRDNGVGFDTENAAKLFQPFQRLHAAEEFEGTGIGLATVRRIVERHGGRIWAEGRRGQGATFFFTLPR